MAELWTIGHGNLDQATLAQLLHEAGIRLLVDVRARPGSRRHPHAGRAALETWLPDAGINYRWEPRLGGWRTPAADSPNVGLRDAALRGYADHMATAEFRDALDTTLAAATSQRTAVMCSEIDPARCHRHLLADAAVLVRRTTVWHIAAGGLRLHQADPRARRTDDGALIYDAGMLTL